MSNFEMTARHNWQTLAPTALSQMENPDQFFQTRAQEAQEMFDTILPVLEGPDETGETYLEKVGRLNVARMQAEETVRRELLTPPEEEQDSQPEDEQQMDEASLTHAQLMRDLHEAMEQARQEQDELTQG